MDDRFFHVAKALLLAHGWPLPLAHSVAANLSSAQEDLLALNEYDRTSAVLDAVSIRRLESVAKRAGVPVPGFFNRRLRGKELAKMVVEYAPTC